MHFKNAIAALSAVILFSGCNENAPSTDVGKNIVQEIVSPAQGSSGEPNLAIASDGTVFLSWIEEVDSQSVALKYSSLTGEQWPEPKRIAQGDDWFVNWADFPSVQILNNGSMAAHWLAKSGEGVYAYDVNIAFSEDAGETWNAPIVPHDDGTQTEHGFASLLPWGENQLFATWLDGRNTGGGHDEGAMTIRAAILNSSGEKQHEIEIDPRVCDCCQTSAGIIPNGAIVAYRDRSENEVRDIWVRRFVGGQWEPAKSLHNDQWEIAACPVNGPFVSTQEEKVAIAWFTMAQETPRVNLSASENAGMTFGEALRVDDGNPLGRVSSLVLPNGDILVCWLEKTDVDADIRVRRIKKDGTLLSSKTIAASSAARSSGFPRMALSLGKVVFAWTHVSDQTSIKTAIAPLSEL